MYSVIRVSRRYEVVVVQFNADNDFSPEAKDSKFYLYSDYTKPQSHFVEITLRAVWGYFSGQADGLGMGELPSQNFDSLEAVKEWHKQVYEKAAIDHLGEMALTSSDEKVRLELLAELLKMYGLQEFIAQLKKRGLLEQSESAKVEVKGV